jgi:hypothetical protein
MQHEFRGSFLFFFETSLVARATMTAIFRWSVGLSFLLMNNVVTAVPWNDELISVGCFLWGWTDPDANSEQAADINTIPKCAKLCRDSSSCKVFKFIAGTSKCFIGNGEFGGNLVKAAEGDISGPGTCDFPAKGCVAELKSGAQFPGDTIDDSMNAWTGGFQPQATQCWERFENASLMPCSDAVTDLGVLDDVKKITSLVTRPSLTEAQCKAYCEADVGCSVWIIRSSQCMTGVPGSGSTFSDSETDATAGGRVMHGKTRDIAPLKTKKMSVTSENVFPKTVLDNIGEATAKKRCKEICVSNVECQFWQLMQETGCWVENVIGLNPIYPLVTAGITENAGTVIDGGYIQHSCESHNTHTSLGETASKLVKKATDASGSGASGSGASGSGASGSLASGSLASGSSADSGSGNSGSGGSGSGDSSDSSDSSTSSGSESSGSTWPWWAWLLLALILLCCCIPLVVAAIFGMGLCDKTKKKKKKVAKQQLVKEEVAAPVQQPVQEAQPVYMVQQQVPVPTTVAQVPVYNTAQMQYQAPVQFSSHAPAPVQYTVPQEPQQMLIQQQAPAQYGYVTQG